MTVGKGHVPLGRIHMIRVDYPEGENETGEGDDSR